MYYNYELVGEMHLIMAKINYTLFLRHVSVENDFLFRILDFWLLYIVQGLLICVLYHKSETAYGRLGITNLSLT